MIGKWKAKNIGGYDPDSRDLAVKLGRKAKGSRKKGKRSKDKKGRDATQG